MELKLNNILLIIHKQSKIVYIVQVVNPDITMQDMLIDILWQSRPIVQNRRIQCRKPLFLGSKTWNVTTLSTQSIDTVKLLYG